MVLNIKVPKRTVEHAEFSDLVPGEKLFSSELGSNVHLDAYLFPKVLPESPAPATKDYTIGVGEFGAVQGDCRFNGVLYKKQQLIAGKTCTLLPAMYDVSWHWSSLLNEPNYQGSVVHLPSELFNKTLVEAYDKEPKYLEFIPQPSVNDTLLIALIQNLYQHSKNKGKGDTLYTDALINMIVAQVLAHHCIIKYQQKIVKGGLKPSILQRIVDYIHVHYNKDISLNELAVLAGFSCYHFSRLFKKSMGLSPHRYVINHRIEKAKELLNETEFSIADVAFSVGYENLSHFRNIFYRATGVTPGEYRKQ